MFREPCPGNKIRGGIILDDSSLGLGEGMLDFITGNFDTNWISGDCVCGNDVVLPIPVDLIRGAIKTGAKKLILRQGGRQFLDNLFSKLVGNQARLAKYREKLVNELQNEVNKLTTKKNIIMRGGPNNNPKGLMQIWKEIDDLKAQKAELINNIKKEAVKLDDLKKIVEKGNQINNLYRIKGCSFIQKAVWPEYITDPESIFDPPPRGFGSIRDSGTINARLPANVSVETFLQCLSLVQDFIKLNVKDAEQNIQLIRSAINNMADQIGGLDAKRELLENGEEIRRLGSAFIKVDNDLGGLQFNLGKAISGQDVEVFEASSWFLDWLQKEGYDAASFLVDSFSFLIESMSIVQIKKCTGSLVGLPDGLAGTYLNESTCECSYCPEGKILCDLSSWVKYLPTTPGSRMSDELNVCVECCDDSRPKARFFTGGIIGSLVQEFGIPPCTCECPTTKKQNSGDFEGYPTEWVDCDSGYSCDRKGKKKICRSKKPPDNLYGARGKSFVSRYFWNQSECRWDCTVPCYETRPEGPGDSGECCSENQICSGPPNYECISSSSSSSSICPEERLIDGDCCPQDNLCSPSNFPDGPYTDCCKEDEDCVPEKDGAGIIIGTICCEKNKSCGAGGCCENEGDCSGPPWYFCCPSPRSICEGICCEQEEECTNGKCCPIGQIWIGKECCDEDKVCFNPFGESICAEIPGCCPPSRVIDEKCCKNPCEETDECCDSSSSSPSTLSSSSSSKCPEGTIWLDGVCCLNPCEENLFECCDSSSSSSIDCPPERRHGDNECCPDDTIWLDDVCCSNPCEDNLFKCCDSSSSSAPSSSSTSTPSSSSSNCPPCEQITVNGNITEGTHNKDCECEYQINCFDCEDNCKEYFTKSNKEWMDGKSCSYFGSKWVASCAECSSSSTHSSSSSATTTHSSSSSATTTHSSSSSATTTHSSSSSATTTTTTAAPPSSSNSCSGNCVVNVKCESIGDNEFCYRTVSLSSEGCGPGSADGCFAMRPDEPSGACWGCCAEFSEYDAASQPIVQIVFPCPGCVGTTPPTGCCPDGSYPKQSGIDCYSPSNGCQPTPFGPIICEQASCSDFNQDGYIYYDKLEDCQKATTTTETSTTPNP